MKSTSSSFLLISIILLLSCVQSSQQKTAIQQVEKVKKSTKDSLQGIWYSTKDKGYGIKINNDSVFYFNEKETFDMSKLLLTRSCEDKSTPLNENSKNTRWMITFDKQDTMCYYIDELTPERLILIYNGHSDGYIKTRNY